MIDFFGRGGALKPSWYGDCLPARDFPMLIDLYRQGRLDLDHFVSETIGSGDVEEAFARMGRERCCEAWWFSRDRDGAPRGCRSHPGKGLTGLEGRRATVFGRYAVCRRFVVVLTYRGLSPSARAESGPLCEVGDRNARRHGCMAPMALLTETARGAPRATTAGAACATASHFSRMSAPEHKSRRPKKWTDGSRRSPQAPRPPWRRAAPPAQPSRRPAPHVCRDDNKQNSLPYAGHVGTRPRSQERAWRNSRELRKRPSSSARSRSRGWEALWRLAISGCPTV